MRMSSLITTLNPTAETTNPARLIQSPALIAAGSSALIIERGRATLTLFLCHPIFCVLCDPMICAGRDLRARAVPLPSAISQPPISQAGSAARNQARGPSAPRGQQPTAVVEDRRAGQALVSFLVSFARVRNRSARTIEIRQSRSRTLLTFAGLSRADLESVLEPAVAHDWHHRPHTRRACGPGRGRPSAARPGWGSRRSRGRDRRC
jgi:hypothetical protein